MIACCKAKINYSRFTILLAAVLVLVAVSCRKNEETVGADIVANRNPFNIATSDTTRIIAYTTLRDSFATRTLSLYMLGTINDARIGSSACNIYTQVSLPVNQFNFGPNFTGIDSMVLQLTYGSKTAYYGNLNASQHIKVYELDERLSNVSDSLYYSNRAYRTQSFVIGETVTNFTGIDDSVYVNVNGEIFRYPPHLRIKITDPTVIQRFAQGSGTGFFADNNQFQDAFKGFAIQATATQAAGDGAVAYMSMNSAFTTLVIYYNGNAKAEFPLTVNTIRTNQFVHQYNPSLSIQPAFSMAHSDENVVQGMGSLKTRVLFPNLFDYVKNNKIAISGAEMIIPVLASEDVTKLPKSIRLLASDSLGRNEFIRDIFEGETYYGGVLDETKKEYRFNINRHIQFLLNEYLTNRRNYNYGLNITLQADNPVTASRAILDTRAGRIKLNLTYSVIP